MEPILSIEHLCVELPPDADRKHAVEDVSCQLMPNEVLCVVGESGSGKSVMAQTMMGLLPEQLRVSRGRVVLEGEELLTLSERAWRGIRGRRMSMIFQDPMAALNPLLRIGDQISEAFRARENFDRATAGARALELLASVGLSDPDALRLRHPFSLSGGQRQRVMIAIALALEPKVLIADEPTASLDVTTQAQIIDLLKQIQAQRNMAILFITHDLRLVAEIADRVAVMQCGRIVEVGPAERVLDNPLHPYTQALIEAVQQQRPPAPRRIDGEVVLQARELSKTYRVRGKLFAKSKNVRAVKDVSFALRRGETLGVVGESGSGKTTIGRMIVRLIKADTGSVWIGGVNMSRLPFRQLRAYRPRIQMIFQDPYASLNPRRTVARLIAEGLIVHGMSVEAAMRKARELLSVVGLDPSAAGRYPNEFSGGQRQRICIARALALGPEILVADEAVSALDVTIQKQILTLLDRLRRELALAILFITHDLCVAAQVCDRIAVVLAGEIVESGPTAAVLANPQHAYTRRLLATVPGRDWRGSDLVRARAAAREL